MGAFPETSTAPGFPSPEAIVDQKTQFLYAQMEGWMGTDHQADGTHGRVRAISVSSTEGFAEFGRSQVMAVAELTQYDPALFSANGAMTWTPPLNAINNLTAARMGNLLHYQGQINGTSVGGVANTALRLALPWDLVCVGRGIGQLLYADAGGALTLGYVLTSPDDAFIEFYKLPAANWTLTGANNTTINFNILFPVKNNPV